MQRSTGLKRKAPLAKKGKSETTKIKDRIQALLREIVILRDGGCVVGRIRKCGNETFNPNAVYQAEHLIERSNSATYADSRLVVCVCRNCHGWKHFKKSNHDQYDAMVKSVIEQERVKLWERCEQESWKPHRTSATDWRLHVANLEQERRALQPA